MNTDLLLLPPDAEKSNFELSLTVVSDTDNLVPTMPMLLPEERRTLLQLSDEMGAAAPSAALALCLLDEPDLLISEGFGITPSSSNLENNTVFLGTRYRGSRGEIFFMAIQPSHSRKSDHARTYVSADSEVRYYRIAVSKEF